MKHSLTALAVLLLASVPAISRGQVPVRRPRTAVPPTPHRAAKAPPAFKPFDTSGIDTTCAPCEDFFGFANGSWLKATEIPPAYSNWGMFAQLDDRNKKILHEILDDAAAAPGPAGTNRYRLGTFFATCMDSSRADSDGVRPIAAELRRIDSLQKAADLEPEISRLREIGVSGIAFSFYPKQDFKNSAHVIAVADQGGLGLPDRDYYLKTDSASVAIRTEY